MNLKNITILILIGVGVWGYFAKTHVDLNLGSDQQAKPLVDNSAIIKAQDAANLLSSQYRCDGRQYCSQMTSREEAQFFANNCFDTKMDGDGDGVPCKNDSRW